MRDEKMLEKLATHDVQNVSELFSLADKCARATEGRAWHSQPTPEAGKANKPDADAATQSSGKNRKKEKKVGGNKPLAGAPTTAAATTGRGRGPSGDKQSWQLSGNDEGGPRCPVHNSMCHNVECRKIKKLAEQFCEHQK
jgi:hypothetical protein